MRETNVLLSDELYCNKRLDSTKQFQKFSALVCGHRLRTTAAWRTHHVATLQYIAKKLISDKAAYKHFKETVERSPSWMTSGLVSVHVKTWQKVLQLVKNRLAVFLNTTFGAAGPCAMMPSTDAALAAFGALGEGKGRVSLLTRLGLTPGGTRPRFLVKQI